MSWRDDASEEAQRQLDQLLNLALGFAQDELGKHGEFFPFAVAVDREGQAALIAGSTDEERPRSADVIESCTAQLVALRDGLTAAAITADARLTDGGDAISVALEHSQGQAMIVLLPYVKGEPIEYGELRAQPAAARVWAA